MPDVMLHHVSIVAKDLDRSVAFYQLLFELERLPRPPFTVPGAWLGCGDLQIHIVHNPDGTYRPNPVVDANDGHFAFRTDDFEGVVDRLVANGFRPDAEPGDPMHLFLNRHGRAGFPQLYICDPDGNIVEVNGAPERWP